MGRQCCRRRRRRCHFPSDDEQDHYQHRHRPQQQRRHYLKIEMFAIVISRLFGRNQKYTVSSILRDRQYHAYYEERHRYEIRMDLLDKDDGRIEHLNDD